MTQVDPYSSDAESAFEMLVSDGCKLIFGMTSSYTDAITAVSQRHPDVYFAQFEGKTSDNCVSYSCNDYNTIAMCGYAVALTSKQDQLGFIACQPQASIIRACDAFSAGAKYANPNAKVKVMRANQAVCGLAMVMFGTGLSGMMGKSVSGAATFTGFSKISLPLLGNIPILGPIFFNQCVLVYALYILVPLATCPLIMS